MKTVPLYELKGDKVVAYEKADIENLAYAFKEAHNVWVQEWIRQGAKDEGSCVVGNGLTVNRSTTTSDTRVRVAGNNDGRSHHTPA